MVHGAPDDSNVVKLGSIYRVDDLAELAIRLGSPHLFDRRGGVLWATDWRAGLGDVETGVVGAESAVELWTGVARQGAYAVNLHSGPDAGNEAHITKYLPLPSASVIGLEVSFSVGANTNLIQIYLRWNAGTAFWYGQARYDHSNDRFQYESPGGTWVTMGSEYNLYQHDIPMHVLKLAIDTVNLQYQRAILDDQAYDISSADLVSMGAVTRRGMEMRLYHFGDGTGAEDSFIDNVVITQNEP